LANDLGSDLCFRRPFSPCWLIWSSEAFHREVCATLKALRIEKIDKNFGGLAAVVNINIDIEVGERRALIGPNGAGKTTLFNIIGGMIGPSAGKVYIFETDVTGLPPHRRVALGLGRTYQITNLFSKLTVIENLLLSLKSVDRTKQTFLKPLTSYGHLCARAESLMGQAAMWEKRDVTASTLSYGEQRRLEVLMALAQEPKLLLLDEFFKRSLS